MADTWDVMPKVPEVDGGVGHYHIRGAEVADGQIWVLLLYYPASKFYVVAYDPDSNTWTDKNDKASLTFSGSFATMAWRRLGDWFYYYSDTNHFAYNWKTDVWVNNLATPTGASTPGPKFSRASSYALNNRYMAYFGGYVGFSARGQISIYDTLAGTWNLGGPPWLPVGASKNEHYVGRIGNKIYTRRGVHDTDNRVEQFEVDIITTLALGHPATVETTPTLPNGYNSAGGCSDGERMYHLGGHNWAGSSASAAFHIWKPGDVSWTAKASHPQSQGTHQIHLVRLGDYIWSVGGDFDTTWDVKSLCRYTPDFSLPPQGLDSEKIPDAGSVIYPAPEPIPYRFSERDFVEMGLSRGKARSLASRLNANFDSAERQLLALDPDAPENRNPSGVDG